MATIDDLLNAQAYRRAAMAEGLAMGKEIPPGEGGSPYQPYKPKPSGPYSPPPPRKPNNNMMIANDGPSSPVKVYEGISTEDGKPYLRVLPNYGGAGINHEKIRLKPGVKYPDLAHHSDKHFSEPTIDQLIEGIINGDIPKGTLGPEEDRMIEEYRNRIMNQSMLISGAQDLDTKMNPLQDGSFLDEDGNRYLWSPREQKFLDMGPYDPDVHGLPIPLANKNKMTIA